MNQITFSVNAIMISHAQITSVAARIWPSIWPIFSQVLLVTDIHPFKSCKNTDTNISIITDVNSFVVHQFFCFINLE